MATQNDGNTKTFTAGEDLAEFRLVKLEAGTVDVVLTEGSSAADKRCIGIVQPPDGGDDDDLDDGKKVVVRGFHCMSAKVVLGSGCEAGAILYTGASGKATPDTTSGERIGYALEDGDANDIVEFVPQATCDMVGTS